MAMTRKVVDRRDGSQPGIDRDDRRTQHVRRRLAYVVDDDAATRHLLGEVATDLGWKAERFGSLRAVREALSGEPPDVQILDDDLPDGKGGDFAVELRSDDSLRRTPIIFCTAAEAPRRREIGRIAPVIGKPFDLRTLERLLDEVAGAA